MKTSVGKKGVCSFSGLVFNVSEFICFNFSQHNLPSSGGAALLLCPSHQRTAHAASGSIRCINVCVRK